MASEMIDGARAPRPPHRNRVPPPSCCRLPLTAAIVRACAMIGASSSYEGSRRLSGLRCGSPCLLWRNVGISGRNDSDRPHKTAVIARTNPRNSAASSLLAGVDRRLSALQLFRQEGHRAVPGELGGRRVVAGRRGVVVEGVVGALVHVDLVGDAGLVE